jgi:hypothetical protein
MSAISLGRRHGRLIILIGLDREDVDHLIAGDVIYLEAKLGNQMPDLAVFAGETANDLIEVMRGMEKADD